MKPRGARLLYWDMPARVCHWGFAFSLGGALGIGFQTDPDSDLFKYHMPLGALAGWFIAIRFLLGWFGSPVSRWRAWRHRPAVIACYFRSVLRWRTREPAGVNPGTALFAPLVYCGAVLMITTGFVAEWSERWHEPIAWCVVVLIALHLAGLILHALRHRAVTPLAMLTGYRLPASPEFRSSSSRVAAGLTLLGLSLALAWVSWRYFDLTTCTLSIPLLPEISFPLIQRG